MLRLLSAALIVALFASTAPADEEKVPLDTKIPEEMLVGTPPDVLKMLFPELEDLPEGEPEPFLVPKGTKNLSLKKKVTSSETNPILGKIDFVTDGVKEGDEESFVELSPGPQWVQIDLEAPAAIHAIYVWHFFREARSYNDIVILVSNDETFKEGVTKVYSNDVDNSLKLGLGKSRAYIETFRGKVFDAKGVVGRYVRLYSNGNTLDGMNHYIEVEVFGVPVEK